MDRATTPNFDSATETIEELGIAGLKVVQPIHGFRFGTDAVALARFVRGRSVDVAVDIGCGCAIIPILLVGAMGVGRAYGVELQPRIADMAKRSVQLSGLDGKVTIVNAPIQQVYKTIPQCSIVTANPPYFKTNSGQTSDDVSVATARFEASLTLSETVTIASQMLATGGKFCIVYKVDRLAEVVTLCSNARLEPKVIQWLGSKLFLLQCTKDGKTGLKVVASETP